MGTREPARKDGSEPRGMGQHLENCPDESLVIVRRNEPSAIGDGDRIRDPACGESHGEHSMGGRFERHETKSLEIPVPLEHREDMDIGCPVCLAQRGSGEQSQEMHTFGQSETGGTPLKIDLGLRIPGKGPCGRGTHHHEMGAGLGGHDRQQCPVDEWPESLAGNEPPHKEENACLQRQAMGLPEPDPVLPMRQRGKIHPGMDAHDVPPCRAEPSGRLCRRVTVRDDSIQTTECGYKQRPVQGVLRGDIQPVHERPDRAAGSPRGAEGSRRHDPAARKNPGGPRPAGCASRLQDRRGEEQTGRLRRNPLIIQAVALQPASSGSDDGHLETGAKSLYSLGDHPFDATDHWREIARQDEEACRVHVLATARVTIRFHGRAAR